MIELQPLNAAPKARIEGLLDRAFGTDRLGRTAYKVREGVPPLQHLSFLAFMDARLLGSLHSWPVVLTQPDEKRRPLVMVGPIAVEPEYQGQAVGTLMTSAAARRLDRDSQSAMMIGDPEYYEQFGFLSGPASQWLLPGPAEPNRVLLRAVGDDSWPAHGRLSADLLRSAKRLPS